MSHMWSLAKEVALGTAAVTVSMYGVYRGTLYVMDRLRPEWYASRDRTHQKNIAGRMAVVGHHAGIALGSLASLLLPDQSLGSSLFRKVLIAEVGFDVSDLIAAIFGRSMTGLSQATIIHHAVSVALEAVALLAPQVIPWRTAASFSLILLGSGAVDLAMMAIVPDTPFENSRYLPVVRVVEVVFFLTFRGFYFLKEGLRILQVAWNTSHPGVTVTLSLSLLLLTMYHLLLGFAFGMTLYNGGRRPKRVEASATLSSSETQEKEE